MFKKYKNKPALEPFTNNESANVNSSNHIPVSPATPVTKSLLQFHCQLAHGSPTAFVSGFSNVKELYQKIADCFDIPSSEILFCTLNTHKIDMRKLLGGQIGLEDFIFAHRKGTAKEVELQKTDDALGLTITDNGAGYAFIKRIKENSIIHNIPHIQVGDHIEKLNGINMVGKRHFEVAKFLKEIPKDETFTIRLIEPLKTGFGNVAPKSNFRSNKKGYGKDGKGTLRFKAGGKVEILDQDDDDVMDAGCEKINGILESFLGINDSDLATQIWEFAIDKTNSMDFADAIDNSDLEAFGFSDDLIIEIWGAITDARDGRLNS